MEIQFLDLELTEKVVRGGKLTNLNQLPPFITKSGVKKVVDSLLENDFKKLKKVKDKLSK